MDEMTSREIQFYFQDGGDLVFIPFGPISGHGAFIPVGMHAHWANALSVLAAEMANGFVHPVVTTVYAGATRSFRGTVSFPLSEQAAILERIAVTLLEQGFKRIVLVGATTPENTGGYIAARDIFDKLGKPVWFVTAENLLKAPEVHALYKDYSGNFGETLLCLAAMRLLGRGRPIPYPEWAKEDKGDDPDQPHEITKSINAMRMYGSVGFRYYEEGQHGNHGTAGRTHNGVSDVDLAEQVLRKSAELMVPVLDDFTKYVEWMEKQEMKYVVPTERLNDDKGY
jgi:creatinine amidohydrolase/Fe(II)-dependent formamide hydrolase-like protein